MRAECFRRLLLAREDVLTEAREARSHRRVGQRGLHGEVQLGDDCLRGVFGHPERVPAREVESGQARIRCNGHVHLVQQPGDGRIIDGAGDANGAAQALGADDLLDGRPERAVSDDQ